MAAVPCEQDQRIVRHRAQRRTEDGQQREIVLRIDREGQQLHQIGHLARLVETAAFEDEVRNVLLQQRATEHVEIGEPPEEDCDVTAAHRPGSARRVDTLRG